MLRLLLAVFALGIAFAMLTPAPAFEGPKKETTPTVLLVGSWKLVSAKDTGNGFTFPEGYRVVNM